MRSVLQFFKMIWVGLIMGVSMGIIIPVTFSIALPFGLLNVVIHGDSLKFVTNL